MPSYDVVIAGAGIAGACAALALSRDCEVLVVEADEPAAGASGAAAGLVNPLMGRKAKAVWRIEQALTGFMHTLADAGAEALFHDTGVLRPTVEEKQVQFFQDALARHGDYAEWLPDAAVRERFPAAQTCGGALWIPRGGAIDVTAFVRAVLAAAQKQGATLQTGARVADWTEEEKSVRVEIKTAEGSGGVTAGRLVLAIGYGYTAHPAIEALGLHGVKGQTVRVRQPAGIGPLIPMSGRGYIVPEGDTLILGSSYDHDFDDLTPSPEQTAYIQEKTARMLPAVADAEVVDVQAGVRVYADDSNLPLLGPLPGHDRTWAFTALGSKGLLTAPHIARRLPAYLDDPAAIPESLYAL